jgi:hypothetical protein
MGMDAVLNAPLSPIVVTTTLIQAKIATMETTFHWMDAIHFATSKFVEISFNSQVNNVTMEVQLMVMVAMKIASSKYVEMEYFNTMKSATITMLSMGMDAIQDVALKQQ